MTPARFLYVRSAPRGKPSVFSRLPAELAVQVVDQYDLDAVDGGFFHGFDAILLTMHVDQIHLLTLASRIERYLADGGAIVFNGPLVRPFLDGLDRFRPLPRRNLEHLRVHRLREHPAFAGVPAERLSLRRGVAGFWGRGHNPMPPGAVPLHGLGPDRVPVDWVWHRPAGGTVLCHAGNDIWTFLEDEPDGDVLPLGVLRWLADRQHVGCSYEPDPPHRRHG